ncbi:MAG: STAS domain-containing protein, partial [Candidatus Methylumidiphilus sp.]
KLVRAHDGRMVLCGIPCNVQALLELTRLNEIFEVYADTEKFLAEQVKGAPDQPHAPRPGKHHP